MKICDQTLTHLLNDLSYIAWLKNEADQVENRKWNKWLKSDHVNEILTEKARKLITMPFVITKIEQSEIDSELRTVIDQLEEVTKSDPSESSQLRIHGK